MASNQEIRERLNEILSDRSFVNGSQLLTRPALENRIFTNRNLKMSRIRAVGFDLDYTLAQYRQEQLDSLVFKLTVEHLVNAKSYPESILDLSYNHAFAIRGLVIDVKLGNVLKMDKFRYVSLAFHGLQKLSGYDRREIYNQQRVKFHSNRFRVVDTLFELVETYLFSALIHRMEELGQVVDYAELFADIRETVDLKHRDHSLKREIMAAPGTYIHRDPLLVSALYRFSCAGKTLFVVTNSEADYTEFVLDYLFHNADAYYASWRQCFELVCSESRKPAFFGEGRPWEVVEEEPCFFASGGSLSQLEAKLGIAGDEILYVGDHIYGDILRSKRSSSWRTCMVVPELKAQVRVQSEVRPLIEELMACESRHKELAMGFHLLRNQLKLLYQFKEAEADDLVRGELERIDDKIAEINRKLEENNRELSRVLYQSHQLRNKISSGFNHYWGNLFQTGGQLSAFAEQVRDYACIYTSSVSNFNFYSSQSYLQSFVTPMPHELDTYPAELDFDESMERD